MTERDFKEVIDAVNKENTSIPNLPSYERCQSEVERLSNVKMFSYKMCVNHCMAFTDNLTNADKCYLCDTVRDRYKDKTFTIPSPSQLITKRFTNKEFCKLYTYKLEIDPYSNSLSDVWHSKIINHLKYEDIVIDGKNIGAKHFSDYRESAFGLASDGISIFKSQKKSCWPVLLVDYNLPPTLRTKTPFLIYLCVVPGVYFVLSS